MLAVRLVPRLRDGYNPETLETRWVYRYFVFSFSIFILDTLSDVVPSLRDGGFDPPSGTDGATTKHFGHPVRCSALSPRGRFRSPVRHGRRYNKTFWTSPSWTVLTTESSRSCGTSPRVSKAQRNLFLSLSSVSSCGSTPTFWTPVNLILDTHPETLETRWTETFIIFKQHFGHQVKVAVNL